MISERSAQQADRRAAKWFARLSHCYVPLRTVQTFQAWRRRPGNAEAYGRVHAAWRGLDPVASDPAIRAALREAMERGQLRRVRRAPRRRLIMAGAAAGVVAGAAALILWTPDRAAYRTDVGELRTVSLEDGSSIRLDTGSQVAVAFGDRQRIVTLQGGQARFHVAHDERPFVVMAGGARIEALGTAFDVRLVDDGARVVLLSGVVQVRATEAAAPVRLAPGQALDVRDGRPEEREAAGPQSWAEGRLIFRQTRLDEAVAELNRYRTQPIVIAEPDLGATTVTGAFETADTDAFIAAASDLWGLSAQRRADGAVHLSRSKD